MDSKKDYSASINLVVIDTESGTTLSSTAGLTRELYESPKDERNNEASQLIIERMEKLRKARMLLPGVVDRVLENPNSSEQVELGNLIIVMNSNFYGSALAGDVHEPNITFIQEWNQVKNDIDIDSLKLEIEKAIDLIQKSASEREHYSDLANLSFARDELKKADGPEMLKYLKKVGEFGLDVIKGMGSSILVNLLIRG
jgi:hypothetical protein